MAARHECAGYQEVPKKMRDLSRWNDEIQHDDGKFAISKTAP